jgi:tRNA A37 N6-isopentenylltransferase MiaA
MGIGVSVFTITLGLILKFAIKPDAMTDPVDIHVIGVILIIVGGAMFGLQMLMMSRMQQRGPRFQSRRDIERTYDDDNPPRV